MRSGLIILIICKTLLCATALKNPFKINAVLFDQEKFTFKISWCTDSTGLKNGISGGITASFHPPQTVRPEIFFLPSSICGDTILSIYDLHFDTTYTIEFWAKYQENLLVPESLSTSKIRVFSQIKQPVSFFDPTRLNDTVRALNGKMVLWKGQDYLQGIPPHEDTVFLYKPAIKQMNGFVQVGAGIKFANPEPSLPFSIALSIDSIPANCKRGRALIYRDSLGLFVPELSSKIDASGRFITLKTNNIKFPLVVMIDTISPSHKLISKVLSIIESNQIDDTVEISDNSANLNWSLFCMPGAELPLKPIQTGIINGIKSKIICRIPSIGAQDNGIRALLIVSDGSNTDTMNLSKSGIRTNSDPFTTESGMIMPLFATAILDSPSISACLKPLFGSQKFYDKSAFRIFRWTSELTGVNQINHWVEYEPKYESLFQIKPGVLFWIVSDKSQPIDLGKGVTVSLSKPHTVTLSPKNWTDLSNPFGFNIKLSDIFNLSSANAKNVHVYTWKAQKAQKTYSAELMYSLSVADKTHDTIRAYRSGYTIYNPFDTAITLQFPSYPYGFYSGNLPKIQTDKGFSLRVTLRSGKDTLNSVYCCGHNFSTEIIQCPPPPSFNNSQILIKNKDEHFGIVSYPQNKSSLSAFELIINNFNKKDPLSISAQFIDNNQSQKEMKIVSDNRVITSSDKAYLDGLNKENIKILVGKSSDISNFTEKSGLSVISSPSFKHFYRNRQLIINMDHMNNKFCIMELYDLQGKLIFKKDWFSSIGHVNNSIHLPASGTYILKINLKSDDFKTQSIVEHISCM